LRFYQMTFFVSQHNLLYHDYLQLKTVLPYVWLLNLSQ
jgi:hypothetical protein